MNPPLLHEPPTNMGNPITVEVYADIVCPWCFIGLRRLERALAGYTGASVLRHWRPFQLRPEMPMTGRSWQAFVREKFGGEARAQDAFQHVTDLGHTEGIDFRFDRVASAPNTTDAHRLILFARTCELEWETARAFMRGYFTEGRDLSNHEHLLDIATQAGLDADKAKSVLSGDAHRHEVLESQNQAQRLGITGVPFYTLNGRYGISGAQAPDAFIQVFERLEREQTGERASLDDNYI